MLCFNITTILKSARTYCYLHIQYPHGTQERGYPMNHTHPHIKFVYSIGILLCIQAATVAMEQNEQSSQNTLNGQALQTQFPTVFANSNTIHNIIEVFTEDMAGEYGKIQKKVLWDLLNREAFLPENVVQHMPYIEKLLTSNHDEEKREEEPSNINIACARLQAYAFLEINNSNTYHHLCNEMAAALKEEKKKKPDKDTLIKTIFTHTASLPKQYATNIMQQILGNPLGIKPHSSINTKLGTFHRCVYSPNGEHIATTMVCDNEIKIFDLSNSSLNYNLTGHDSPVNSVAYSPCGQYLASGSDDSAVKIWHPESQRALKTFKDHRQVVKAVAWSPTGDQVASSSNDETIKLWNPYAQNNQPLTTFTGHTNWVSSVAYNRDGSQLASADYDGKIALWDTIKAASIFLKHVHKNSISYRDWIRAITYHSSDKTIISGGDDCIIYILDSSSGKQRATLNGHQRAILSLSLYGHYLASSAADQTINIWDLRNNRCLYPIFPLPSTRSITSVAFSPSGNELVFTSLDSIVRYSLTHYSTQEMVQQFIDQEDE